jgi:YD repeat-containing protein
MKRRYQDPLGPQASSVHSGVVWLYRLLGCLAGWLVAEPLAAETPGPAPASLPSQFTFVAHPHAWRVARHPALPVLYLGCNGAPGQKNLVTFGLDAGGNVLTNTMRECEDYFTDDGGNPTNSYSVLTPIVLPSEKVLLLGAYPANPALYQTNTNAQHVAAVALDERGEPTGLLKALRTTHTEQTIVRMQYDPAGRRLCLSHHSYWGWVSVNQDGLPSREFRLVPTPYNFWDFTFVPSWQRFLGLHQNAYLCNLRLTADGSAADYAQALLGSPGPFGAFQVSPELRKVYILSGPGLARLSVYPLAPHGGFTSVPRQFPLGATNLLRLDAKARRLYSLTDGGVIRIQPLDAEGWPSGSPEVFSVVCGAIRDAIVDEVTGKLMVASTAAPQRPE